MTHSSDPDGALAEEVFSAPPASPLAFSGAASLGAAPPQAEEPPPRPATEPEPAEEVLPEFDERYRTPFEGLLFLGHLSNEVTYWGHRFLLVTPSTAERLEIALLTSEYERTLGYEFAYSTALVAAYLVQLDDVPLPQPITTNAKDTALQARWTWVKNTLKRPVIERLFEECYQLDATVREILDAMGKA